MYRAREDILADMLAQLVAAIPDAYTGEDGVFTIKLEIEAGQLENLFLAHQILLEDSFITTASYTALQRHGEQYNLPMKTGTKAAGSLKFTGVGGEYVGVSTEVAYDPGGGLDPVYFITTLDGTIPNPGIPGAPTAAINVAAGNLNGLYEYMVTFLNTAGETTPSAISNAVSPVNQQINLTAIPLGGPGTTQRSLYRRLNGTGNFRLVATIPNNTATTFTDNATDAVMNTGALAPTADTAHSIVLPGEALDEGAEGNVSLGVITVLSNAPSSLTSVINTTLFSGGSDPEDTEEYRQRLLAWVQNPHTGSPSDLETLAESVNGVETATVFENTPVPGTTTVRISGPGGTVPSAQTIADTQAALDTYSFANMTIIVTTFTAIPTNVTVDVTPIGTYTLADVTPVVVQAVTDYINNLSVAAPLKISGIIDTVYGLSGVDDVVVTTPSSNQTTPSDSKRTPGTITVT